MGGIVTYVHCTLWLEVQAEQHATVELRIGFADPDLVGEEDRSRREEFVDLEANELLRLFDRPSRRDDPPGQ